MSCFRCSNNIATIYCIADYEISYRPKEKMEHTDAFSQVPNEITRKKYTSVQGSPRKNKKREDIMLVMPSIKFDFSK